MNVAMADAFMAIFGYTREDAEVVDIEDDEYLRGLIDLQHKGALSRGNVETLVVSKMLGRRIKKLEGQVTRLQQAFHEMRDTYAWDMPPNYFEVYPDHMEDYGMKPGDLDPIGVTNE